MTNTGQRTLLVLAAIAAVIASGLGIEFLLSEEHERRFGHTQAAHVVGWAGLALILLVFVYPIRKRAAPSRGWPSGSFLLHQIAGVLGPALIIVHAGSHLHAIVPMLALATLALIVISGIVGQCLHAYAVRSLHERQRSGADMQLSRTGNDDVHLLAEQEQRFRVWQYLHAPLTATFLLLTFLHIGAAIYFGGF